MNKRITITREQVDNILEMCKDSFPEYSHVKFETRYGVNEFWFDSSPDKSPDPHEFHWFELVVTELSRVILERLEKLHRECQNDITHFIDMLPAYQSGGELLYNANYEGLHVADVLYKEFKKLKKWEQLISKQKKQS